MASLALFRISKHTDRLADLFHTSSLAASTHRRVLLYPETASSARFSMSFGRPGNGSINFAAKAPFVHRTLSPARQPDPASTLQRSRKLPARSRWSVPDSETRTLGIALS